MSEASQFVVEIADLPAVPVTERSAEALFGASTARVYCVKVEASTLVQAATSPGVKIEVSSFETVAEPAGGH